MNDSTIVLFEGDIVPDQTLNLISPEGHLTDTPAGMYLSQLSANSQNTMYYALLAMARMMLNRQDVDIFSFPWHEMKLAHILMLRSKLAEKYSLSTANNYLAGLRAVLKAAWKLELLSRDELERRLDFEWIDGIQLPAGRALTTDEVRAMFQVCSNDKTLLGARDLAMISMLYSTGMRRSELTTFNYEDLEEIQSVDHDWAGGWRGKIHHGKGNRARYTYVNPSARRHIERWLDIRSREPGVLICRVDKLPRISRMDPQTIYDALRRRSIEAGIPQVRPHDWRRTFVTKQLDQGVDLLLVRQLAGHSSVETTARYDRRAEDKLIGAAFSLQMPEV